MKIIITIIKTTLFSIFMGLMIIPVILLYKDFNFVTVCIAFVSWFGAFVSLTFMCALKLGKESDITNKDFKEDKTVIDDFAKFANELAKKLLYNYNIKSYICKFEPKIGQRKVIFRRGKDKCCIYLSKAMVEKGLDQVATQVAYYFDNSVI